MQLLRRNFPKMAGLFLGKMGIFASSISPLKHRTFKRENCLKKEHICLLKSHLSKPPFKLDQVSFSTRNFCFLSWHVAVGRGGVVKGRGLGLAEPLKTQVRGHSLGHSPEHFGPRCPRDYSCQGVPKLSAPHRCVVRCALCVGHLALPVATSLRCNFWQISCCFVQ